MPIPTITTGSPGPTDPNAWLQGQWELYAYNISTGTWTVENAVKNIAMDAKSLAVRMKLLAENRGLPEAAQNAARAAQGILERHVAAEAAAAEAAEARAAAEAVKATARAATGGRIMALLRAIGSWLGLTGTAATVAGTVATVAVLAGLTYLGANLAGRLAADRPVQPGPSARSVHRVCPPKLMHKTMCPWGPQGGSYEVKECGPGWCWDGGGHGTGACKQIKVPANGRRSYTNDVFCADGFTPTVDECTGVLLACS